jgi:hypothetical protein
MVLRPCLPLPDDPFNHPLRSPEPDRELPDAGTFLFSFRSDLFDFGLRELPERRPSNVLSLSTRFIHPHGYAAANKVMLEFRHSANNVKQQPTCRTGAVQVLFETQEVNAQPL